MTQAAAQLDFVDDGRAYCGATFNPVLTFWEDTAESEPTDLTGSEFRMLIFKSTRTTPVAELISSGLEPEYPDIPQGTLTIQGTDSNQLAFLLSDEITLDITPGRYSHHIEQIFANGTKTRPFEGAFFFDPRNRPE